MAFRSAALLLPLALAAAPVRAGDLEFFTGQALLAQCSAKPGDADYPVRRARCEAYVIGVSDAQQALQGAGGPQRVCLPATAGAAAMAGAATHYLNEHPEKRPMAAQDLVIEALSGEYPCR